MDKIYHVYDKENHCIASVLSEDEFKKEWESKTKESEVEYIELEVNKDVLQDASYWQTGLTLIKLTWRN